MSEINKLEDTKRDYSDIINLKRPISKYKKMTIESRSAQFAPFAALTGYSEEIKETSRITGRKIELSDDKREYIDKILDKIRNCIKNKPFVNVTYFVPDSKKSGGRYVQYKGRVRVIDQVYKRIIFEDKLTILINDILEIDLI